MAHVTFTLPSSNFTSGGGVEGWTGFPASGNGALTIPGNLLNPSTATNVLDQFYLTLFEGNYEVAFEAHGTVPLSALVESQGQLHLSFAGNSFIFRIAQDTADQDDPPPYYWRLPNAAAAYAAFEAVAGTPQDSPEGTLIIWDGAGTNPFPNTADTTAPMVSSAATNTTGTTITITFDEGLDESSVPATGDFNVQVAGSRRTVSSLSVSGTTVVLTLSSAVTWGQTVTLRYTSGTNPLRDDATTPNNFPTSTADVGVTNNLPTPTLTVGTATVDDAAPTNGDTVVFTCPTPGGTATGAITYQWQSLSGSTWTDISGATSSTYSRTQSSASTVTVRCVVTRQSQTANSGQVSATWSAAAALSLAVAIAPDDTSPTLGDTVTWTATLSGTATTSGTPGTPTYQWQQITNAVWNDIAGETGSTYAHTQSLPATITVRCQATQQGVTQTSASSSVVWSRATPTRAFPDTRTWEVPLPAARYTDRSGLKIWEWGASVASSRPKVPGWLEHNSEDAYLSAVVLREETTGPNAYRVILHFEPTNTGTAFGNESQDISSDFEATGWIRLNDGTNTWELDVANDVVGTPPASEPYRWTIIQAKRAAYTAFHEGLASSAQAATLTITDGVTAAVGALPDADVGTVAITGDTTATNGDTVRLTVTVTGNTSDTLSYAWTGGTAVAGSPNQRDVTRATAGNAVASVVVTATGTGTNAASGTSDVSDSVEHTVVFSAAADTTAPAFASAATNAAGTTITITFSEALDDSHVPPNSAFTVGIT